jgi:WD40 repeat protein
VQSLQAIVAIPIVGFVALCLFGSAAKSAEPPLIQPEATFRHNSNTSGTIAWMPDGKTMLSRIDQIPKRGGAPNAAAGGRKSVFASELVVWDTANRKITERIEKKVLSGARSRFSRDGSAVVMVDFNNVAQLVKIKDETSFELRLGELPGEVNGPGLSLFADDMAISPESNLLVFGTGKGVALVDIQNKNLDVIPKSKASENGIRVLGFSRDGKALFGRYGNFVDVWEWPSRKLVRTLALSDKVDDEVRHAAISDDGTLICTLDPGSVEAFTVWDVQTGKVVSKSKVKTLGGFRLFEFVPNSGLLITDNGPVQLWDSRNGIPVATLKKAPRDFEGLVLAPSPNGKRVAAWTYTTIQFWDISEFVDKRSKAESKD